MLLRVVDMRNPDSWASKLRRSRFAFFESLLNTVPRPLTICDVGGTADYWRSFVAASPDIHVTIVNLADEPDLGGLIHAVKADARSLPFASQSFDVVVSNSVIEHVGDRADQQRMADEVRRIGKRYFVQTPSYDFPMEPHFLFPFWQRLPVDMRAWMLTKHRIGWFDQEAYFADAKRVVDSIKLLRYNEFCSLFPGASIYEEKLLGMTKSFTAYAGWDHAQVDAAL